MDTTTEPVICLECSSAMLPVDEQRTLPPRSATMYECPKCLDRIYIDDDDEEYPEC